MSESSGSLRTPIALWLGGAAAWRPRVSRRLVSGIVVALSDTACVQIAFAAACLAVRGLSLAGSGQAIWSPALAVIVAVAALLPNACLNLYDTAGRSPVERFRLRAWGALMMPVLGLAMAHMMELPTVTLLVLLVATSLALPLALLSEAAIRAALIAHSAWGATAVLVGTGAGTAPLASFLLAHPDIGLRPMGFCGEEHDPAAAHPVAHLGTLCDTERLAGVADVAIVALTPGAATVDLATLPFSRVIVAPEMTGIPALWLRPRGLGGSAGFEFANATRLMADHRVKRALDLLIAAPMFLLVLPLIGISALLVKFASPGPAFYTQRRVGLRGVPISIYKLRTMHADAEPRLAALLASDPAAREQWATCVKLSPDPRVIPFIGAWMRRLSIDELPQLWHVVTGEMSFVGPRPFPSYHHDRFGPDFQRLRTSVRPGLTGLWQVSARSDADLRQQERIDTFYIRNWSLWLDVWIALRTLPAVLSAQGAR